MKSASGHFNDEQRRQVNQAVAAAEARTAAEIVPVVARASGRYDRPEDVVGLWLGGAAMAATWALLPAGPSQPGDWGGRPLWTTPAALLAALLAGFFIGALIASRLAWLRRLFTPARQMADEVAARAKQVFFDSSIHHTAGATGLLLYISLFERRAVILADQAVLAKLGQPALDEICATLTASLGQSDLPSALHAAIQAAGEKLAAALPRQADDRNEVSNALVLLD